MNNYDLAVLIPARNEQFLSLTVENILKNKRGKTQVLVGLDGEWASPPVKSHPDLTIVYTPEPWGQRGMTNQLCRLTTAKWVMKIDAHCTLDEGFDIKLLADARDHQTILPALYNLHAFDWLCKKCGNRWYQSPTPEHCMNNGESRTVNEKCDGKKFEKVIVFKPRKNKVSYHYRFDTTLHFQYHGKRNKHKENTSHIVETFSAQGSCFMLTRDKYWGLGICDEAAAGKTGWGQQGTEIACKTWLSGGQLVTNKNTWYAHMFRTQGGDFGFPYKFAPGEQDFAREFSRNLWFNNAWDKQIYPLSWLLEKFDWPEDWSDPKNKEVKEMVIRKGEEFYTKYGRPESDFYGTSVDIEKEKVQMALENLRLNAYIDSKKPSRSIVYYTDNQIPFKFAHNVRKHILKANLPIVSASLKPMQFGKNIHMKMTRGYEAYFRQILAALEASESDIVYFCEHDWLYHPSHFDFVPERKDTFYYNWNWWRIRSTDGHCVHYDTQLVPGIVAYRELFVDYYRKAVAHLEKVGFTSKTAHELGFEPGSSKRVEFAGKYRVERFDSKYPILDVRHGHNLTASKWSPDEFRNPKNAQGWIEKKANEIPGWNFWPDDDGNFSILNLSEIE